MGGWEVRRFSRNIVFVTLLCMIERRMRVYCKANRKRYGDRNFPKAAPCVMLRCQVAHIGGRLINPRKEGENPQLNVWEI
jgi:hypothetical protein